MPISNAVHRLGGKWLDVIDKVREAELPAGGLTIQAFGVRFLDVPPNAFDEVAHALARKGVVWIGNDRGVRKVYRKKPEGGLSWRAEVDSLADALAEATKHAVAWGRARRAEQGAGMDNCRREAIERQHAAVERIVKGFAKATAKGLSLSLLRADLPEVFCANLVAAIVEAEPALQPESMADRLDGKPPLPKRERSEGEGLFEHVGLEIERRGKAGAGKSDLLHSIRPYRKADEVAKVLVRLEDEGHIASVMMVAPGAFRKATRWFMPDMLPDLDGHGRAIGDF